MAWSNLWNKVSVGNSKYLVGHSLAHCRCLDKYTNMLLKLTRYPITYLQDHNKFNHAGGRRLYYSQSWFPGRSLLRFRLCSPPDLILKPSLRRMRSQLSFQSLPFAGCASKSNMMWWVVKVLVIVLGSLHTYLRPTTLGTQKKTTDLTTYC